MSQSEFVRTMVQAGRRFFDKDTRGSGAQDSGAATSSGAESDDMREEIPSIIESADSPPNKQRLIDELQGGFEERSNSVMSDLQSENKIQLDMDSEGSCSTSEATTEHPQNLTQGSPLGVPRDASSAEEKYIISPNLT